MSEVATHTSDRFVVFDNDIDPPGEFVIMTDTGKSIATVHASDRVSAAEARANAYLFAAAPKMLAALRAVISLRDKAAFDQARAVIAEVRDRARTKGRAS
jgi:hypothetical protein